MKFDHKTKVQCRIYFRLPIVVELYLLRTDNVVFDDRFDKIKIIEVDCLLV